MTESLFLSDNIWFWCRFWRFRKISWFHNIEDFCSKNKTTLRNIYYYLDEKQSYCFIFRLIILVVYVFLRQILFCYLFYVSMSAQVTDFGLADLLKIIFNFKVVLPNSLQTISLLYNVSCVYCLGFSFNYCILWPYYGCYFSEVVQCLFLNRPYVF